MSSEWSDRKRVHRRTLALGIGMSVAFHAAVLAWAGFPVPMTDSADEGPEPDRASPPAAFEVVRLADAPSVPDVNDTDEVPGARGAPTDAQNVTEEGPAAEVEAESVSTPPEPEPRARAVTADRETRDLRTQLEPRSLAIDVPAPTTTASARPAPTRTASVAPAPEGEAGDGDTTPEGEVASDGDGAADGQEDEGGWGLGDFFRGVSIDIHGGACPGGPPDLVSGRPAPAVTSVNDRDPFGSTGSIGFGGSVGTPGPSGATDPAASIGRIGGGVSIGGIGGRSRTGGNGRIGGIRR